ncbi:hypothetical protein [Chryseobacterium aquaticum]|uniref:C1q domain-containing protein n=1 Tax=Chryseobacterium aquaticum subsp. greenlandense TaxID=345663 RepID=A0A101CD02_9FLAO|nr:hypothetical protein [Chryseobacterium aquaticum]KUJ53885.1 hypothetical protein AR686_18190 [Chryseobacterium aquaticum subsp. greenlandense]
MKKIFLTASIVLSTFVYSQTGNVGINTADPKATLDVAGSPTIATKLDGVIAPRITGEQLRLKTYTTDQTGAIVYVTAAALAPLDNQVIKVSASGYYYFDGAIWQTMAGSSGGTYVEPWNEAATTNPATSNTQNIYQTGNVGIGNTDPQNPLHITATADPARLEGLQTGSASDKMVVADANGVLKTLEVPQVQVLRIGVNGEIAGTSYVSNEINALRFDKYNDDAELGYAPPYFPNYVNTITGSSFTENTSLGSFAVPTGDNAVPASRTTDAINLPAGLYEITLRVRTRYPSAGNINSVSNMIISVNNDYYAKLYGSVSSGSSVIDSSVIIDLTFASSIDFLLDPLATSATPVVLSDIAEFGYDVCFHKKQILKSEIIIKRIGTSSTSTTCAAKKAPK